MGPDSSVDDVNFGNKNNLNSFAKNGDDKGFSNSSTKNSFRRRVYWQFVASDADRFTSFSQFKPYWDPKVNVLKETAKSFYTDLKNLFRSSENHKTYGIDGREKLTKDITKNNKIGSYNNKKTNQDVKGINVMYRKR